MSIPEQGRSLRVNGRDYRVTSALRTSLLLVLRNELGLKGAKIGCDFARQCGACAVLCDGEEIPSCATTLAEVGEREITTPEGIGSRSCPTPLQLAMYDEQASQCGYCIPGMMVAATALLSKNPQPTIPQIKAALNRHICRCGTYTRIVRAVHRAATNHPPLSADIWPAVTTSLPAAYLGESLGVDPADKTVEVTSTAAWLTMNRNGHVTAYSGKVDMGTGIRTALIQIVAEELDVDLEAVCLVMADSALCPNQGKSTASVGVAIGGQPLRVAACEARAELLRRAASRFAVPVEELDTRGGAVFVSAHPERLVRYGELLTDGPISRPLQITNRTDWGPELSGFAPFKPRSKYRYVGRSVRRDIVADHLCGTMLYVHNIVVPGMLHGRVVLPADYFARLVCVDKTSIADLPNVQIVRRGDFLGVVAEKEEIAILAASRLKAQWGAAAPLYEESAQFEEMKRTPIVDTRWGYRAGDADSILSRAQNVFEADFHYACQLHAMIGPSCAVADVRDGCATIWSGTQSPYADRNDIAQMLGLLSENVRLIYREAAGSYGRLGCDDAAADAALMSQSVGRPVRVQWSRRDELGWAPVAPAMTMNVKAVLNADGRICAWDYTQCTSTHASAERGAHVAWVRIGAAPGNDRLEGYLHGQHYEIENKQGKTVFIRPTLRTIYLRGPGSVQAHFAIESSIDELAARAECDPVEFRLRHLAPRDREVLAAAAELARWQPRWPAEQQQKDGDWLQGRGVAYTRSGFRPSRVAVIIDVRVNRITGDVVVDKACMAHDCGYMVNPDGVLNQVQGNILHGISRALYEEAHYTRSAITTLDWNSYPVLRFTHVPEIEIKLIQRPDLEPTVVGETSSIPMVGAVGNAICDAIGQRLYEAPFTRARVLQALRGKAAGAQWRTKP